MENLVVGPGKSRPGTEALMGEQAYQLAVVLYVFRWNRPGLPGRKGQLCKVNRRGKMNSCEIEFLDGQKAIVSRNSIKKYRGAPDV